MNIVITAEHSRELAGFSGGEDILVYSNKGKSPIEYYLLLKRFILKNKADAIVNFGIAGSLDTKIPMGKVVSVRKVFYLDPHSLKYLGPVLDIGSIREDYENLLTLTDICEKLAPGLAYSGKILDLEGYFIALIGKELDIPVFIFKTVSDYNKTNSIDYSHIESGFKNLMDKYIPIIEEIVINPFKREFYMQYKFYDKKIFNAIEEKTKKHKTFTERQYIYKDILTSEPEGKHPQNPEIETIYIEKELVNNNVSMNFIKYFKNANVVEIDNYLKLFSYPGREYHDSKREMNIFIARKRGRILKETPVNYGLDGTVGYAMTNMFNCIYDCDYCYLAGYFSSGDIVVFTNYDDMAIEIENIAKKKRDVIIYAGDFSDSLLFDNLTGFSDYFYEFLREHRDVLMEIRTKRGNIENLLKKESIDNLIIAVSVSPEEIIRKYENRTMGLEDRIKLLKDASFHGYKIGIRMDPIIDFSNVELYQKTLIEVIESVKQDNIHSIGVGMLRMTKNLYKSILRRRKRNKIIEKLTFDKGMYRYNVKIRENYYNGLKSIAKKYSLEDRFYITME
ncbi:hypothetical protein DRP44_05690 [candidate division TA06 bacterium]|uniref:Uncharacterized protein n=1 Tax=candidate division TA06 bacterium TaxID=2250710 RepID=A0A660S716_UNCT6|nr:MAG: hypothetical protein DRP44_05690 [candidate division TA06 bacterium]